MDMDGAFAHFILLLIEVSAELDEADVVGDGGFGWVGIDLLKEALNEGIQGADGFADIIFSVHEKSSLQGESLGPRHRGPPMMSVAGRQGALGG